VLARWRVGMVYLKPFLPLESGQYSNTPVLHHSNFLFAVTDSIYGSGFVIGNQQRFIVHFNNIHRPPPGLLTLEPTIGQCLLARFLAFFKNCQRLIFESPSF
jgi:hypothetical protein